MTGAKEQAAPTLVWRAESLGSTLKVHFTGALDIAVLTECVTGLDEPLAGPERTVEFDVTDLNFADSSALRFLLDTKHRCDAAGKRFVLAGRSGALSRLLEVSGLNDVFERDARA
jgi:anti-sigma B factor antagonist